MPAALIASLGLNILSGVLGSRAQKKALAAARAAREQARLAAQNQVTGIKAAFFAPKRTLEVQIESDAPALRAARATSKRLRQRSLQSRQMARRQQTTPDQLRSMLLSADIDDYIAQRAQRTSDILAMNKARSEIVAQEQGLIGDVYRTSQATDASLFGLEMGAMAEDPFAKMIGAAAAGFAAFEGEDDGDGGAGTGEGSLEDTTAGTLDVPDSVNQKGSEPMIGSVGLDFKNIQFDEDALERQRLLKGYAV